MSSSVLWIIFFSSCRKKVSDNVILTKSDSQSTDRSWSTTRSKGVGDTWNRVRRVRKKTDAPGKVDDKTDTKVEITKFENKAGRPKESVGQKVTKGIADGFNRLMSIGGFVKKTSKAKPRRARDRPTFQIRQNVPPMYSPTHSDSSPAHSPRGPRATSPDHSPVPTPHHSPNYSPQRSPIVSSTETSESTSVDPNAEDPTVDPYERLYAKIQAGLFSTFTKAPPKDVNFLDILRYAHQIKTKLVQEDKEEESKQFLEKYYMPLPTVQPENKFADSIRLLQLCIKRCSSSFGYAFIPKEGYEYTGDVVDFFANGKLLPITHGEVSRDPHHAPKQTRPGFVTFQCDCVTNLDFLSLMTEHKVSSAQFFSLKAESPLKTVEFLKEKFGGTDVQILSDKEFLQWLIMLFKRYKLHTGSRSKSSSLTPVEGRRPPKYPARRDSDSDADSDYWEKVQMMSPKKADDSPPNEGVQPVNG